MNSILIILAYFWGSFILTISPIGKWACYRVDADLPPLMFLFLWPVLLPVICLIKATVVVNDWMEGILRG